MPRKAMGMAEHATNLRRSSNCHRAGGEATLRVRGRKVKGDRWAEVWEGSAEESGLLSSLQLHIEWRLLEPLAKLWRSATASITL